MLQPIPQDTQNNILHISFKHYSIFILNLLKNIVSSSGTTYRLYLVATLLSSIVCTCSLLRYHHDDQKIIRIPFPLLLRVVQNSSFSHTFQINPSLKPRNSYCRTVTKHRCETVKTKNKFNKNKKVSLSHCYHIFLNDFEEQ